MARLLLLGAILSPGRRTVPSILFTLGKSDEPHFQNFPRVLNRARWSARHASRILLDLLVQTFAPAGPLLVGWDDPVERRWGPQMAARGIDRDPVRSSWSHFVKVSGLRWLSLLLLVDIPWAGRVWALPFPTVLAPSERYDQERQKWHKRLLDRERQMIQVLSRSWQGLWNTLQLKLIHFNLRQMGALTC